MTLIREKSPGLFESVLMVVATYEADFEEFWLAFPRRVGKLAAQKVYQKARRGGVTQEALLDGIAAYRRSKPDYADWCHPRTWLMQGRWMDEGAPVVPDYYQGWNCPHTPSCGHPTRCQTLCAIEAIKKGTAV